MIGWVIFVLVCMLGMLGLWCYWIAADFLAWVRAWACDGKR